MCKKNLRLNMFVLMLITVLVISLLPLSAAADENSGPLPGEGTWSLSNGTLTITGIGDLYGSYNVVSNPPFYSYRTQITSVIVEQGVTGLGKRLFKDCMKLQNVSLPSSLTDLGDYTFYNCDSLESIRLPNTLTSIGAHVFNNCTNLSSVTIPESVTEIESYAFFNCDSLTSIIIPEAVGLVGYNAFSKCDNLTRVEVYADVIHYENIPFGTDSPNLVVYCNPGSSTEKDASKLNVTIAYLGESSTSYTVNLHANGGSVSPSSITVTQGNSYGSLPTPERSSYSFNGWYTSPTGGIRITASTPVNLSANQTLYAQWTKQSEQATPSLANFSNINNYRGQFSDVSSSAWYYDNVVTAYGLGLMKGIDENYFGPLEQITRAQAVTLAARMHSIYHNGTESFIQESPWYQVYIDYAAANGIISSGSYSDYTRIATRREFVSILAAALPNSTMEAINNVDENAIPDVSSYESYSNAVYKFYRAGILTGSDRDGTFYPSSGISRAETAAIISRMVQPELRLRLDLSNGVVEEPDIWEPEQNPVIPVSEIDIKGDKGYVLEGYPFKLTFTVQPRDATYKEVFVRSDNNDVIRVGADGNLYFVSPGEADIICSTEDYEGYFTLKTLKVEGTVSLSDNIDFSIITIDGKYLRPNGNTISAGSYPYLWHWNDRFIADNNWHYQRIWTGADRSLCFDVDNANFSNGTTVKLWEDTGYTTAQYWTVMEAQLGTGKYYMISCYGSPGSYNNGERLFLRYKPDTNNCELRELGNSDSYSLFRISS